MHNDGREGYYDLSVGKYDVVVEVGPSFNTQREEVRDAILEFIRVYPQSAPVLGDLLAKHMDWPQADVIARRLQALLPPPVQGAENPMIGQMKQAIDQLTQQLKKVEDDKRIDAYNADTNRIKALADAHAKGLQVTMNADGSINAVPLAMPQPMAPPGAQMDPQQPPSGGFSLPEQQVPPAA
jgi:hypothetical protein